MPNIRKSHGIRLYPSRIRLLLHRGHRTFSMFPTQLARGCLDLIVIGGASLSCFDWQDWSELRHHYPGVLSRALFLG
jgi:hypothetical protein